MESRVKERTAKWVKANGEFKQEIGKRKRVEEAPDIKGWQPENIFDSIDQPIYVVDQGTCEFLYANEALKTICGDVLGRKCFEVLQHRDSPCPFCTNDRIFGENVGRPYIWEVQNKRSGRWYHCIDKAIRWPAARMVRFEMAIDITDRKKVEEALQDRENELEMKSRHLQESESALKVLLRLREKDKRDLREDVVKNVREFVFLYLNKLSKTNLN